VRGIGIARNDHSHHKPLKFVEGGARIGRKVDNGHIGAFAAVLCALVHDERLGLGIDEHPRWHRRGRVDNVPTRLARRRKRRLDRPVLGYQMVHLVARLALDEAARIPARTCNVPRHMNYIGHERWLSSIVEPVPKPGRFAVAGANVLLKPFFFFARFAKRTLHGKLFFYKPHNTPSARIIHTRYWVAAFTSDLSRATAFARPLASTVAMNSASQ